MQVCTLLQTDIHASTPPLSFFTGRMPFLPPNQQRQSTEGTAENVKQRSVACHSQLNMYRLLNIVSHSRFVEMHF